MGGEPPTLKSTNWRIGGKTVGPTLAAEPSKMQVRFDDGSIGMMPVCITTSQKDPSML